MQTSDTSHQPDDYYTIAAYVFQDFWCFPTRKNSTLTSLLSRAIIYADERGLIDSIYSKYFPQSGISASLPANSSPLPEPITVGMISGALIVLVIGLVIGFAAFIIEKLQLPLFARNTNYNSSFTDIMADTKTTEERIAPWTKACEDAVELIKKQSGNQRTENQLIQEYLNYLHAWNAAHADLPVIPPCGGADGREATS